VARHVWTAVTHHDEVQTASTKACTDGELVFLKAEDESLAEAATWTCSWEVPQEVAFKNPVGIHKVLMCVRRTKLLQAMHRVAETFQHDVAQHGL
jgi:hypothetical protein